MDTIGKKLALAKRTPVVLTMELTPGKTFVKLVNVEFLSE